MGEKMIRCPECGMYRHWRIRKCPRGCDINGRGMPKSGQSVKAEDLGDCPFCLTGKIAATAKGENEMGVLHTLPYCETFEKLGVIEFLKAVGEARTMS